MFGFGKEKKQISPVAQLVVENKPSRFNKQVMAFAGLRKNMWVAVDMIGVSPIVGILTAVTADGMGEVTKVKPDGTTMMILVGDKAAPDVLTVPLSTIRNAYINEIPSSRHSGEDQLRSMGYTNKGGA
jgi:hypothetical protein